MSKGPSQLAIDAIIRLAHDDSVSDESWHNSGADKAYAAIFVAGITTVSCMDAFDDAMTRIFGEKSE